MENFLSETKRKKKGKEMASEIDKSTKERNTQNSVARLRQISSLCRIYDKNKLCFVTCFVKNCINLTRRFR